MRSKLSVAVVCATSEEYKHCKNSLRPQLERRIGKRSISCWSDEKVAVAVIHAGPGKIQCASGTQLLIDEFAPDVVIDAGAAGSLDAGNEIGSLICGQNCFEYDICPIGQFSRMSKDLTTSTLAVHSSHIREILIDFSDRIVKVGMVPSFRLGNIVSGEKNVIDAAIRDQLRKTFDAIACDWETAAVLKTASLSGVESLSFRIITDRADAGASQDYKKNLDIALERFGRLLKVFLCDGWVQKVLAAKGK